RALNDRVDRNRVRFVHHHHAHAMSAFALSGFDRSLILTIDGIGEEFSGMVMVGDEMALKRIADFSEPKSLGSFYINVIRYLGFRQFDEYKVMGLAPYGDPAKYRELFKDFYTLLPNGDYMIHSDKLSSLSDVVGRPRMKGDPFMQTHRDIAASLQ